MKYLTLEVCEIDVVVFDESDRANTRGRQIHCDWRSQPAGADEEHTRRFQASLASLTNLRQQDVAAVAHLFFAA